MRLQGPRCLVNFRRILVVPRDCSRRIHSPPPPPFFRALRLSLAVAVLARGRSRGGAGARGRVAVRHGGERLGASQWHGCGLDLGTAQEQNPSGLGFRVQV